MRTVAALYIDPRGPYPKMTDVDCWDEARNAKLYDGPHPVVAHPPCGPWGRMKGLCTRQDFECGLAAVKQVERFGGVLEQPQYSALWKHLSGAGIQCQVEQVSWGHPCVKPTWLYVVGVPEKLVRDGVRSGGVPTKCVTGGPRSPRNHRPRATDKENKLTPVLFAEWLVSLAREAVI